MSTNNRISFSNITDFIKQLTILHFALMMGQILFLAVVIYLHSTGQFTEGNEELHSLFQFVIPLFAFGSVAIGFFLFIQMMKSASNLDSLSAKLEKYRSAFIVRLAIFEGGGLLSLIAYLLTRENLYFISASFIIILFIIIWPSQTKLLSDMRFSEQEKQIILNNEPI